MPPVLSLREAAALLRLHENTVRAGALAGTIPGAKIGRNWRFLTADLIGLVRDGYRMSTPPRERGEGAGQVSSSAERAELALDLLLERAAPRRRS